jgi:hypothetical protein
MVTIIEVRDYTLLPCGIFGKKSIYYGNEKYLPDKCTVYACHGNVPDGYIILHHNKPSDVVPHITIDRSSADIVLTEPTSAVVMIEKVKELRRERYNLDKTQYRLLENYDMLHLLNMLDSRTVDGGAIDLKVKLLDMLNNY